VEALKKQLQEFCEQNEIKRLAADEMVELLEDGETAEWIIEQVLPDGPPLKVDALKELLAPLREALAPQLVNEELAVENHESEGIQNTESESETAEDIDWNDLEGIELPPGVDPNQIKSLMQSPRGALVADFGSFCDEKGFNPDEEGADQEILNEKLRMIEEEWLQTPRQALEGKKPSEILDGGRLFPTKVETFKREAPKVGRNDPCPCGSGKKYKKCCGKAA
jgi:hypothetical protein